MSRRTRQSRQARPATVTSEPGATLHIERPQLWSVILPVLLIFAVTLVAYLPALDAKFIWDDDAHVTRPGLRSLSGLSNIWFNLGATQQYYPLLHSVFWVEHRLWGLDPFGYHLANILFQATAAVLVYAVVRKLNVPGALLAALVFAVHPVHVESVAWVTEQKNTISGIFYLAAMWTYLEFDQTRRVRFYWFALSLFVLGLLTKTVTATLPAALLVIFWWQRNRVDWRRDVVPLVPFFVLGAVAGLFTAWVERKLIGAEGPEFAMPWIDRALLAGRVPWFYLSKLLWPANLMFVYPRWHIDPSQWWQWLFPLATLAMLAGLWAIRRRTRAPLAAALLFLGTLFPALGFLNVYPFRFSFVADHFQYLASIAIIVLASAGITLLFARGSDSRRWMGRFACVALIAILSLLTWRQSTIYADSMRLFTATVERNPLCWMAYFNLGRLENQQGNVQRAIERYEQALEIRPNYSTAHNNLANIMARIGRTQEAVTHYEQAIAADPQYAEAHNGLGAMLAEQGRADEAIEHYRAALRIKSDYPSALINWAIELVARDRFEEAIDRYQKALEIDPQNALAHNNLGIALARLGRTEEATLQYQRALSINPNYADALNNLAVQFAARDEHEDAIANFQRALRVAPNTPQIHFNLAESLLKNGRADAALQHYRESMQLDPGDPRVFAGMALALAELDQPEQAIEAAQDGVQLARRRRESEMAARLEAWLNEYQSNLAGSAENGGRARSGGALSQ